MKWNFFFAYFFTWCPYFRGHGNSRKVHHFPLCLSSSFFFSSMPHAHKILHPSHSSRCCNSSARFTSCLHWPHGTSSWSQCLTECLASSLHQRHSPLSKFSMLNAIRFLQNSVTDRLHFRQVLSLHVKPTETVTAWHRHFHVENWIFAKQSKKPRQKTSLQTQARFKCVPTFCGWIIIHIFTLPFILIQYSKFTDRLLSKHVATAREQTLWCYVRYFCFVVGFLLGWLF